MGSAKIVKLVTYSLLVSILAYIMVAVLLALFYFQQTGWSSIDEGIFFFLLHGLTLGLSGFDWLGDFYTIAVLVPWLSSTLVLVLLLHFFHGRAPRRRLFAGLSICIYYFANWLSLIIEKIVLYGGIRGDIDYTGYLTLLIWPIAGFGLGYLSAIIVEKLIKTEFAD